MKRVVIFLLFLGISLASLMSVANVQAIVHCREGATEPYAVFDPDQGKMVMCIIPEEEKLDINKRYCWKCLDEKTVDILSTWSISCPDDRKELDKDEIREMIKSSTPSNIGKKLVEEKKIGCEIFMLEKFITKESKETIVDVNDNGLLDNEDYFDVITSSRLDMTLAGKRLVAPEDIRIIYEKGILSFYVTFAKQKTAFKYGEDQFILKWGNAITFKEDQLLIMTEGLVDYIAYALKFGRQKVERVDIIEDYKYLPQIAPSKEKRGDEREELIAVVNVGPLGEKTFTQVIRKEEEKSIVEGTYVEIKIFDETMMINLPIRQQLSGDAEKDAEMLNFALMDYLYAEEGVRIIFQDSQKILAEASGEIIDEGCGYGRAICNFLYWAGIWEREHGRWVDQDASRTIEIDGDWWKTE